MAHSLLWPQELAWNVGPNWTTVGHTHSMPIVYVWVSLLEPQKGKTAMDHEQARGPRGFLTTRPHNPTAHPQIPNVDLHRHVCSEISVVFFVDELTSPEIPPSKIDLWTWVHSGCRCDLLPPHWGCVWWEEVSSFPHAETNVPCCCTPIKTFLCIRHHL